MVKAPSLAADSSMYALWPLAAVRTHRIIDVYMSHPTIELSQKPSSAF